ncbi:MAG: DnaJ domain-containing protein [Armatimonadota bacterium]|nr:DnaJ domain-containing protein [Armatimonadota bacterium]
MAKLDYYECLGISQEATHAEVKRAYRRMVKANHPDSNPDDPEAAERLKEIVAAYELLGDARRRARYDRINSLFGPRIRTREEVIEEKSFEWTHRPYSGRVRLNSVLLRRDQARKAVIASLLLLFMTCALILFALASDGFTRNPFRYIPRWRVNSLPLRRMGLEIVSVVRVREEIEQQGAWQRYEPETLTSTRFSSCDP